MTTDIKEMQRIQAEWIREVLPTRDIRKTCIKLCSESAEVAEAIGYLGLDAAAGELADVLILVLDIAELSGIDLSKAFAEKMRVNRDREWVVGDGCIRHVED
jgi:NTP pyrophosphatase (non-canonical NTP hydrolase)